VINCLVLGGAGFIGSNVVEALVSRGHGVRVFDLPNANTANLKDVGDKIEVVRGNIKNAQEICRALDGMDVIVHLVCTTLPNPSNENPVYDVETNLVASINLLKHALEKGVKKVIFASSGGTVYRIPQCTPIPETHQTNPICSYGISKLAIEKYLALFDHLDGLKHTIFRIGNPYGQRQRIDNIQGSIAVFLGKALSGKTITIWGDGSVARDYVYISDVVSAFIRAIETEADSTVYNIACGQAYTLKDILSVVGQVTGRTLKVKFTASRKLDVPINCLDISLAQKELDWSPQVSLEEGIGKFWHWLNNGSDLSNEILEACGSNPFERSLKRFRQSEMGFGQQPV
jgi:UDP-glucose 4-epimerase